MLKINCNLKVAEKESENGNDNTKNVVTLKLRLNKCEKYLSISEVDIYRLIVYRPIVPSILTKFGNEFNPYFEYQMRLF